MIVLSYSRLRFLRFSLRAAMPSFLRRHVEAFRFLGAVPRTILYDTLKSAVLEREGDAVRFHPTLLGLAGHYRFEPRACAPYCPNEKGRVERAIRDVRDNFFAARAFCSIDDLNAQARAWCLEIAHERRVPDARELTVEQALHQELPTMIALPSDDFPVEERASVRVGKTPYVHFDKNDYSVPHTHVQRDLTVIATDERVRVVDPERMTELLADHARSSSPRPAHRAARAPARARRAQAARPPEPRLRSALLGRALVAHHDGQDRRAWRQPRRHHPGLLQWLERVGAERLERAVAEVVGHDQPHLRAIHHALDRLLREAGQPPPLSVPVTTDARAAVHVRPHALSTYDQLHGATQAEGGADDDAL